VLRRRGGALEAAVLTLHGRADYGSGRASRIAVAEAFLKRVLELGLPIRRCIDVVEELAPAADPSVAPRRDC